MSTWNAISENVMKEIGEKSSVLRVLHINTYQQLKWQERLLVIPSLLSSTASAALSTMNSEDDDIMRYIAGGLALLGATTVAISKHFAFGERSRQHLVVSHAYGKLHRQITAHLSLNRSQRGRPSEVLSKSITTSDNITEEAPTIPRGIVESFMDEFENSQQITLPDICFTFSPIQIRSDEHNHQPGLREVIVQEEHS